MFQFRIEETIKGEMRPMQVKNISNTHAKSTCSTSRARRQMIRALAELQAILAKKEEEWS